MLPTAKCAIKNVETYLIFSNLLLLNRYRYLFNNTTNISNDVY
jgi:hypothetical protein